MCAISGVWNLVYEETDLQKMLKTMVHRGPDGAGIFRCQHGALLHTRLAIIDPEGGRQPMALQWEGCGYTLVYNGELYNTDEVRRELAALGHRFGGKSDTEVVLHAYAQWKEDCLRKLNGIFALAVWDENNKRLFLARDRMGVKPLFYMLRDGGMIFASEIKTILTFPGVKAELDAEGAAQILMLGPGRMPGSGVFRGIRELEPGQWAYFDGGKLVKKFYWRLLDGPAEECFDRALETVRELVLDAVKRQMVSDVPMGTFLSGGLDSSLISAICAGEMEKRGEKLTTFSVDYEDNDRYFVPGKFQPESDGAYIDIMSRALQTEHRSVILNSDDLVDALEKATWARDLPGMGDVDFSLLAFCGHIRRDVKMALSGECADEIFGGYPWFRDPEVNPEDGFPWAQNTGYRVGLMHPAIRERMDPEQMVKDAWLDTCTGADIAPGRTEPERKARQMMVLNMRWFMQTLLDRKDRMSMFHGLEVRVPFCDYRIAEYMYRIPHGWRDWNGREKGLLRKAMEGILPDNVLWRRKSPYPKTMDPGYEARISRRLRKLLENPEAPLFSLVNIDMVRDLLVSDLIWPWYGQLMRRPQLMAYLLQVNTWMERYHVELLF